MIIEFRYMGLNVEFEVPLPIFNRGQKIVGEEFRLDIFVEDTLIVELKSVEKVMPVHKKSVVNLSTFGQEASGFTDKFQRALAQKRHYQNY